MSDRSTPQDPHSTALGIAKVWVNGSLAYVKQDGDRSAVGDGDPPVTVG